jgi:hypothetical protein
MEDIDAHVDIHSSKVYCAVAKDVLTQARTQARRQGVSTKMLINLWLQEKAAAACRTNKEAVTEMPFIPQSSGSAGTRKFE